MGTRIKILVIDDDQEMREVLKLYLCRNGYEAESAKSAAEAFVKLRSEKYDLVITDITMKPIDGLLLIASLRERQILFDFIVVTGNDSAEDRYRASELGASGYFVKPFDTNELLQMIHKIIQRGDFYVERHTQCCTGNQNRG